MKQLFMSIINLCFLKHGQEGKSNFPEIDNQSVNQVLQNSTSAIEAGNKIDELLICKKTKVNNPKKKISKTDRVKKHLKDNGSIDSWTAITLYKATRLSSIIFNLRNYHGMDIDSISSKDESNFVTYVLIPKDSSN